MSEKLLLATNNPGKLREYRNLLPGVPFTLVSLAETGIDAAVEENGLTFAENARIKAVFYAGLSRLLTLADDSGLEVDALDGEPGVRSARYAGEGASDRQRVDHLLSRLKGIPAEKRTARFVCVIALARPKSEVQFFEGECRGVITFAPRGEHGFGYDPVFFLPELGKTMAELSPEQKNQLSHRARAAGKARQALLELRKVN